MSTASWERIKEVFQAAVQRQPGERAAFLEQACSGQEALRSEVESLLASDQRHDSLFAGPVFEVAAEMLSSEPHSEVEGRRFGAYEILRELGRGGMGVVYLAVRADDQFQQQVAIKLLRRGMDSEQLLRRFHQERQILANLDHPNIAKLLAGDVTADGLPYFIMEYVDGIAIDEHCERHGLSIPARIELFRQICSAVHHAHRNLVVHRDLKPSNILVTADGVPKLLDFGVAKLLSAEAMPRLITATAAGLCPMTPEYASPEQVRGELITTASDIYSLGVLLYELLTGSLPYCFESRLQSDIERVVSEQQPVKPSTAASVRGPAPARRLPGDATPERLRRRLAGDLDNIVLKALRKDPARRYGSAEQLSEDLHRHQVGLPVVASGDTLAYRVGKFITRHKVSVAAAMLLALSLVAGMLTTSWQAQRAKTEQVRADRVSEFLVELFRLADPYKITGGAVSARKLLDQGEKEIRHELGGQPELLATLMDTIGRAYVNLGLYEEAAPLLEEALEIRRRTLGPAAPEVATSLDRLGSLQRFRGDYEAAAPLLQESLVLRRRLFGEHSQEVSKSLEDLGSLARLQGEYEEAESFYRRALAQRRKLLGERDPRVARLLSNLALLQRDLGRYDEAESLYRQALEVSRSAVGDRHADVAIYLHNLGELLSSKGDYAAAEPLLRRSLSLNRELLGEEHLAVATSSSALALLLQKKGDYEAAEPLLRQALDLRRQVLGEEHRSVANSINLLGSLLRDRGQLTAARALLEEALALRRKLLGPDHLAVAYSLVDIARLHLADNQPERAVDLLHDALSIERRRLPRAHWRISSAESLLGECLTAARRFDEAEPLLWSSYQSLEETFGSRHERTLGAWHRVVSFYRESGRPSKVEVRR